MSTSAPTDTADSPTDRAAMLVALPALTACAPWLAFLDPPPSLAWATAVAPLLGVLVAIRYARERCAGRTWWPLLPVVVAEVWFAVSVAVASVAGDSDHMGVGIQNAFLDGVFFYGLVLGFVLPPLAALVGGAQALRCSELKAPECQWS